MSATKINAPGLTGKHTATLAGDGYRLFLEMEEVYAEQGRVEVVLTGFEDIRDAFLESAWGMFLLASPDLAEAEHRYHNTIFLYDGPTRSLRHMIYEIGRQSLQQLEKQSFQATA